MSKQNLLFALFIGAMFVQLPRMEAADRYRAKPLPGSNGRGTAQPNILNKDYTTVLIPVPDGYIGGQGIDINNRREVGGTFISPVGLDVTFLWKDGVVKEIRKPGALITLVPSLTDSGYMFGNWGSFVEQTAGFYHIASDRWLPLPPYKGKPLNVGFKANNAGRAFGISCEGNWFAPENCELWFYDGNSFQALTPPDPTAQINGINDRGQLVGVSLLGAPTDFRSFLIDGAKTVPVLPGGNAAAFHINNRGQILVTYQETPGAVFVPGLVDGSNVVTLPLVPGAFGTSYFGMNDRGDFTGVGYELFQPPYPVVTLRK
jgi:hypothetical protein